MADNTYIFQILGESPGNDAVLSPADLAAVRGAVGLTESEIPEDLVHEFTHAAAAELEIIRAFPVYSAQVGADWIQLVTATRLLTASRLASHMQARIAKQERIEGAVSTTNFEIKWGEVAARLRATAYDTLLTIQAYYEQVIGVGVAPEDIPGPPLARANGWSRNRISLNTYPGFVVK